MQISEKIFKAVELFKKKDLWAKITLTVLFLSYLSFCRACFFNPIAGEDFPIYENNYPGDLYGFRAKNKGAKQCELDGKKIFLERENQNESFCLICLSIYQSLARFLSIQFANCTDSTTKIDKPADKGGFLFVF